MIDTELYTRILSIDSTSGRELQLARALAQWLPARSGCQVRTMPVGDGTENLQFTWGNQPPVVTFCTHQDTVPPFISPSFIRQADGDTLVRGRGSCDAKGQLISMLTACEALAAKGQSGFSLLLLAGEETGSYGAKAYAKDGPGGHWVIVGEPTDCRMVTASKGTKAFSIEIKGKSCHSGYPEQGSSAVMGFVDFINRLSATHFPTDPVMGATTWNVGKLSSDNPQNVLSPSTTFRLYFRTTAASDEAVCRFMEGMKSDTVLIEALGGDTPMTYDTLPGFDTCTVAFGSDTPRLTNFKHRSLCGPGSILVAHQPGEHVLLSHLERASRQYIEMFHLINNKGI